MTQLTARAVTRVDPVSGVRETAGFIPRGGKDEFFIVRHAPPAAARAGIVICGSLFAEQLKLYRAEVRAARALAAQGFAVARFHYWGMGHSGGHTEEATLTTMLEDAARVADLLGSETGAKTLIFSGARWGGFVAGLAAARYAASPVVLWEPVLEGARFFRETFRAKQMSAVAGGRGSVTTVATALEELRSAGFVDVLGYSITASLVESASRRRLVELASGPRRSILLIQVSRHNTLRPECVAFVRELVASGSMVATRLIARDEAWSFVGSPVQSTDLLIDLTSAWLGREGWLT